MSEPIRSLADSLRTLTDERLEELLTARDDLTVPLPRGIGPLAARAAARSSVQRALTCLTLPELRLAEALAVLPDGSTPADLARAVGTDEGVIAPFLQRLRTLALAWGQDELHAVRALSDLLRTPAGLAPVAEDDPSPREAREILDAAPDDLRPLLERLAWGPSRIEVTGEDGGAAALRAARIARPVGEGRLQIPRTVHLALRGGRVRAAFPDRAPTPEGDALRERIPGARTAQAVEAAFEAVRILGTSRDWAQEPPGVLRRGGLPQRELRRLAREADATPLAWTTVMHSAWEAGQIGHDGESWHLTREGLDAAELPLEERWAELVLGWAHGSHLAHLAGRSDASGSARAALSEDTRREGARERRAALLRALVPAVDRRARSDSLEAVLAWTFPLVAAPRIAEEADAFLEEGAALGVILDGALTELGLALARVLEMPLPAADRELASVLHGLAPAPVDEVLLDADLTVTIPGRPSERLSALLDWTEVVSRGGAMTVRFTAESVRRALGAGHDAERLLDLLRETARTPVPQALEYLLRDEVRRRGRVHIGRASTYLTAQEEVLTRFQGTTEGGALSLRRLAPTVAVTDAEPGFVLQLVRRSGMAGIAVGPDGAPLPEQTTVTPRIPVAGPAPREAEAMPDGPDLRLPARRAVERIREADRREGGDPSVMDRLLEAIARGEPLELGIVDGRGGVVARRAVPVSVDGGRLRARDVRGQEEFTVLVHRVTLG